MSKNIIIRLLIESDIRIMFENFSAVNWLKPLAIFEKYLKEQKEKKRLVWVAYDADQFVGYVTLKWESQYKAFFRAKIPEIMDLNVLPSFRGRGIGFKLLKTAEDRAHEKSNVVGLGVGLYGDYGAAQKLYVKCGYIPDGAGITYNYQPLTPPTTIPLDDDLVLWLTKKLQ